MELVLRIPEGFTRHQTGEGVLHLAPDESWGVLVTPVAPAQPEPTAWMRRALEHDAPAGAAAKILGTSTITTEAGWPVTLVEAELGDERRIVAYLAVFDLCAGIVSRLLGRGGGGDTAWRMATLELVTWARVDLGESHAEPACLAHLLDGVVEPTPQGSTPIVD